MDLVLVTSNQNKAQEVRHILGIEIKTADLDLPELQSLSVDEVAKTKVKTAYGIVRKPVMVEDTGIYIKSFAGFPGALVKWFVNGLGYEAACRSVDISKDRSAYAETCVAFYDGKSLKTFTGRIYGKIAHTPRGKRNFGWDRIFIPNGYRKTFAEMTVAQKAKISMRGIAVRKLGKFLQSKGIRNLTN